MNEKEYERDLLDMSITELLNAVQAGDVMGIKLTHQQQQRILEGAVSDAIKYQTDKRLAEYRETLRRQRDEQVIQVKINGLNPDTVFVGSPFDFMETAQEVTNASNRKVQLNEQLTSTVQLFSDYFADLDDFYKNAVRDGFKHYAGMLHLECTDPDVKPIVEYVDKLKALNEAD